MVKFFSIFGWTSIGALLAIVAMGSGLTIAEYHKPFVFKPQMEFYRSEIELATINDFQRSLANRSQLKLEELIGMIAQKIHSDEFRTSNVGSLSSGEMDFISRKVLSGDIDTAYDLSSSTYARKFIDLAEKNGGYGAIVDNVFGEIKIKFFSNIALKERSYFLKKRHEDLLGNISAIFGAIVFYAMIVTGLHRNITRPWWCEVNITTEPFALYFRSFFPLLSPSNPPIHYETWSRIRRWSVTVGGLCVLLLCVGRAYEEYMTLDRIHRESKIFMMGDWNEKHTAIQLLRRGEAHQRSIHFYLLMTILLASALSFLHIPKKKKIANLEQSQAT